MTRTTRTEIEARFQRLATIIDKPTGYGIGSWSIDNAPQYGGWQVQEGMEHGAIRLPFGYGRRSPKEFLAWLDGAIEMAMMVKWQDVTIEVKA